LLTAIQIIEASFSSSNIEIIQKYEDKNIEIEMFANELVQVFLNIFKNTQDNFQE